MASRLIFVAQREGFKLFASKANSESRLASADLQPDLSSTEKIFERQFWKFEHLMLSIPQWKQPAMNYEYFPTCPINIDQLDNHNSELAYLGVKLETGTWHKVIIRVLVDACDWSETKRNWPNCLLCCVRFHRVLWKVLLFLQSV